MGYAKPEPLDGHHELAAFDCGDDSLNEWVRRYALTAERPGTSRTFVTTDGRRVVGFYSLTAAQIGPQQATARLRKGQPSVRPLPVILLARLAVDSAHQERGLGRSLLQEALLRCAEVSKEIGFRAVVVHAADAGARAFYERFGFERSPTDPMHLILLVKDLKALLRNWA